MYEALESCKDTGYGNGAPLLFLGSSLEDLYTFLNPFTSPKIAPNTNFNYFSPKGFPVVEALIRKKKLKVQPDNQVHGLGITKYS